MERSSNNEQAFLVVQFIELPFEGIDDYVCVPYTWVRRSDQKTVVAYPRDEDPFDTRDRVKRKERYNDEWRFYVAAVKYESVTYRDAEYWIATRNYFGFLVERESTISDTPSRLTLNKKWPSANQINTSKSYDNPRIPLPRVSIKRPALSEPKKQLDAKRLKVGEAPQSSSAVVNDANVEPGCSKRGQSIIIQDWLSSVECAQTEETAAVSNGDKSTEPRTQTQRTEQNKQALSTPVIDVDEPTEVMNIDGEDHSRDVQKPDENNSISQRHHSSNTTAASIIAAEPSTLVEQTTQPNQHNKQEQILDNGSSLSNFQPRIENVLSIATDYNDHKESVNDVPNNEPSASHEIPSSLKMAAHLYSHMNGARRLVPIQEPVEKRIRLVNIGRNLAFAEQNRSNLMDKTASLSKRSAEEQSSVVTQNQSQDGPRVLKLYTENSRDQTTPIRSITISSQDIQHVPKMNVGRSHDVVAIDPRNVLQSETNVASASQTLPSSSHKRPCFDQRLDGYQSLLAEKKHNNLWRFVLPSEYDPHDTRWTLKYRTRLPGLIKLMPQSSIYVSYGGLKYCQQASKDCKSLARRLLPEVFNRKALSVCLSMSEKTQASNNVGSDVRPKLDEHATTVLLNYVFEYGLQCGWNIDLQPILSTLHSKIQNIRFKYGVMVKC